MIQKQSAYNCLTIIVFLILSGHCQPLSAMDAAPFSNDQLEALALLDRNKERERPSLLTEKEKEEYCFYGNSWKEMMQAYEGAPWEVQHIVEHLNHPEKFQDEDYRASFFVGPTGNGKTTAAQAVPHVANWFPCYMTVTDFKRASESEAAQQLLSTLERIVANKHQKSVVIIDHLEYLLERSNDVSRALGQFLDSQNGNRNFFFIGIMNRMTHLPEKFKLRLEADSIMFPIITDPRMGK